MNKNSLVTICMPTFNRPKTLKRALESVIGQTYENLEILVSDNCSTNPDVEPLCRGYAAKDSRIKYFRQQSNIGIYKNASFLTDNVSGEFMFHLCDDDWLDYNFIDECVKVLLDDRKYAAAYGSTQLFDDAGNPVQLTCFDSLEQDSYSERVSYYAVRNMYYQLQTAMYRTSDIKRLKGRTFEQGRFCEDQIFVIKMLYFGKLKIIPHVRLHKCNNGLNQGLEKVMEMYNLPLDVINNFGEYLLKTIAYSILWDDFFVENLGNRERLDIVVNLFMEFSRYYLSKNCHHPHEICTNDDLWRFLWRKPLALFDRKYTIYFEPRENK